MKASVTIFFLQLFAVALNVVQAQSITVNADNYRHVFEGAGTSFGLYLGHHFSMNKENQDKAIRLINQDLNMVYLQDYVGKYPSENPEYFDKRAAYVLDARVYRPDNKFSVVVNNFPDNLKTKIVVDGKELEILDFERETIYDELANWYFEVLKGFHERGVAVDILNMVNEPDWKKKYRYGHADPKKGLAFILKEAVPKLKAMLKDKNINTTGVKIPLIMAPSTLSTSACLNYINYFKNNYPDAWGQVDIVATHQYGGGANRKKFDEIEAALEGRAFYQSEMHSGRGGNLGALPIEKPHKNCLNLANIFGAAVNGGVTAWYYFENNYPQRYHPGGLIRVPWKGKPQPYKQYYAFQQLTSTQPINTHLVEREITGLPTNAVMTFRKMNEDILYLNVSNFSGEEKTVIIEVNGKLRKKYGIQTVKTWTTDETLNRELVTDEFYTVALEKIEIILNPYSVNTLEMTLLDPERKASDVRSVDHRQPAKIFKIHSNSDFIDINYFGEGSLATVQLYSPDARQLYTGVPQGQRHHQVKTSALKPGLYILRVTDNLGKVSMRKIFKF